MQPETKVKENGQAREFTPTEQWDQLAFQVLYRELAPKGFKKVTGGSYKGQIIAVCDGPGLPKSKVTSAQKIAAQLIRGFREKTKKTLSDKIIQLEERFNKLDESYKKIPFWRYKKARRELDSLRHTQYTLIVYKDFIRLLDEMPIK
jgi:hypothetical protein